MIQAEGLGKRYRIRHQRQESDIALRDVIADNFMSDVLRPGKNTKRTHQAD